MSQSVSPKYDWPVVDGFGAVGIVDGPPGGDAHDWAIIDGVIAGDDVADGVGGVADDDDTWFTSKQRTKIL